MKFIVLLAFVACASAAAIDTPIEILKQDSEVNFDGTYHHSFETAHGIAVEETGVLKNAGNKDAEAEEVTGSFAYSAPDGTKYVVHYVANENGFQPQGDHLPVAPEIPSYIQRSLDWIAAHPQPEEKLPGKKF